MIGYFLALLPLYIFIYLPLSNSIYGKPKEPGDEVVLPVLNSSFVADDMPLSCPVHNYNTYILSHEPLMIYIENFVSLEESEHLLKISEDKYLPSTVTNGGQTTLEKTIRNSEVALLDRDNIVRCIEHRARSFQGYQPFLQIERLRTQRYGPGGHYSMHYDWSGSSPLKKADRVSTFMVYVEADCKGGGTEFPRIERPEGGRWCEFVDCDGDEKEKGKLGVVFKPIKGNAVFWENLRKDGRGYEETWHAGLPVKEGTKVGLNIWSWGPARRR